MFWWASLCGWSFSRGMIEVGKSTHFGRVYHIMTVCDIKCGIPCHFRYDLIILMMVGTFEISFLSRGAFSIYWSVRDTLMIPGAVGWYGWYLGPWRRKHIHMQMHKCVTVMTHYKNHSCISICILYTVYSYACAVSMGVLVYRYVLRCLMYMFICTHECQYQYVRCARVGSHKPVSIHVHADLLHARFQATAHLHVPLRFSR